jgi:hypothetical protein
MHGKSAYGSSKAQNASKGEGGGCMYGNTMRDGTRRSGNAHVTTRDCVMLSRA